MNFHQFKLSQNQAKRFIQREAKVETVQSICLPTLQSIGMDCPQGADTDTAGAVSKALPEYTSDSMTSLADGLDPLLIDYVIRLCAEFENIEIKDVS